MALVRKKISSKKQAVLVAALVALFAFTFGVAYFSLWRQQNVGLAPDLETLFGQNNSLTAPVPGRSGLDALEDLNNSAVAGSLKKFGNWPLPLEPRGRADLFALPAETNEE